MSILEMTALTRMIQIYGKTKTKPVTLRVIVDTGAGHSLLHARFLNRLGNPDIHKFPNGLRPSLTGPFGPNDRSDVVDGKTNVFLDLDNILEPISVIILNEANFEMILGYPDIKKFNIRISDGGVFTKEMRILGSNVSNEVFCVSFNTIQTYNVQISNRPKNSALNRGNGVFETVESGPITSDDFVIPEIVDDFTADIHTPFIPLMGQKKRKVNDNELINSIKKAVKTNCFKMSSAISDSQRLKIEKLLIKFRHCISITQDDLGELPVWTGHEFRQEFEVEIPTPCNQHRVNPAKSKFMCEQIAELVKLGVCSPFKTFTVTSCVMAVPKKDGSLRLVCDLRHVNKFTRPSNLKLARADDIVESLQGFRFFTTIDHAKGYWNLPLAKDQQAWFTFQCSHCFNTYCWTRCVMGAKNASTVYSYMVSRLILEGLNQVNNYIDDTCFGVNTFDEGYNILETLLSRLCKYNLRIGLKKMVLFSDSCDILGYNISQQGLRASQERLNGILGLNTPQDKKSLLSGLASMNFHRNFIKGFAHKSAVLWKMTSETVEFDPVVVSENWKVLKNAFADAITFVKPEFDREFILMTDASDFGIGCTLYQDQNGQRVIVGCFSKGLSPSQLPWSIANKELYAVKTGLEQFERWLYGVVVQIHVDNISVFYLLKLRMAEVEIQKRIPAVRFLLYISTFTFQVHHISGKDPSFLLTDFLSRNNYCLGDQSKFVLGGTSKQPLVGIQALLRGERDGQYVHVPINSVELSVAEDSKNDKNITDRFPLDLTEDKIIRLIKLAQYESSECRKLVNSPTEKYRIIDDSVYIVTPSGPKIVVPRFYAAKLLKLIHTSQHESARAMIIKINRMNIFIFNKYKLIDNVTQQCGICDPSRSKGTHKISSTSVAYPRFPFDIVHVDLSAIGSTHILVCVDSMTRFIICRALKDATSKTIRDELVSIFTYFGLPTTCVVDNAANLNSSVMDQFFDTFGIIKSNSSVMRSQANSLAENGFSRLQRETRKFGLDTSDFQYLNLQLCVIAYKLNLQRSPGRRNVSAFEGMFSRYSPWVAALPDLSQIRKFSLEHNLKQFYEHTLEIRDEMHRIIHEKRNKALGVNKYSGLFKAGDCVRVKNVPLKGVRKKLHRPWSEVVFEVIKIVPFTNTMILREVVSDIQYQPRVIKRHMSLVKRVANHKIDTKGDFAPILDDKRTSEDEEVKNAEKKDPAAGTSISVRTDKASLGQAQNNSTNANRRKVASTSLKETKIDEKGELKKDNKNDGQSVRPQKKKTNGKLRNNHNNKHGMVLRHRNYVSYN